MKKISVVVVVIMLAASLFMFTGCTNKKVEESLAVVDEYYESFMDNDPDDIVDLFSDSLVEYYEGQELTEIVVGSRISTLGEDLEYKIVGSSYNSDDMGVYVIIDAEVTYDRSDETYDESFQLEEIDDEMIITVVDFERETIIDEIPDAFFEAYNDDDKDAANELFSDRYYTYVSEDVLNAILDEYHYVLGDFEGFTITEEYAFNLVPEGEDVTVVQEAYYDASFENGTAEFYIVLCVEDDEIKIYNMFTTPSFIDDTLSAVFESIGNQNYSLAYVQYDDAFYEMTEGGVDALTATYDTIAAKGEYAGYEIIDWFVYDTQMQNGEPFSGLMVQVNAQYGDTVYYNEIMLTIDFMSPKIYGHYIE